MTPEDRRLARDLLTKKLVTVAQVTRINGICESTGRSFSDVATEQGVLTPQEAARLSPPRPARSSLLWPLLLGATLFVLLYGGHLVSLFFELEWGMDEKTVEERAEWRAETERKAAEVRRTYQRKILNDERKKAAIELDRARKTMAFIEERLEKAVALPDLYRQLTDAIIGYSGYLRVRPNDATVLTERARAYEIRGDYGHAVQDLEMAVSLDKDLEPEVRNTLQELKLKLPK